MRHGGTTTRGSGEHETVSILSDFEDRVASALEGVFAGAFRSPVQPAEVAKALGRAMDDGRMVGVESVYAPVVYTVAVSPADADNIGGFAPVLAGELATYLSERAREQGYRLTAEPTVTFAEHVDLRLGRFRVSAEHAAALDASGGGEAPPGVYDHEADGFEAGASGAASGRMATLTIGDTDHDVALRGGRMIIGRLQECDICLADANVSRRHTELFIIDGEWYLQDLESTNGTMLNGEPVTRARLRDGDIVEIGVTRLTYHQAGD
jgi:hypothetical protein